MTCNTLCAGVLVCYVRARPGGRPVGLTGQGDATPLYRAIIQGSHVKGISCVVKVLLQAGADPAAQINVRAARNSGVGVGSGECQCVFLML